MADDPGPIDLGFAVRRPPREVIQYFRAKGYAVSEDWWEIWQEMHARAFTVSKAARLDILSDIRSALDQALAEGTTRRQFVRELEPRLQKLGWWGRQVIVSPDGEARLVQLGSPRRLKTIYDVNMRSAFGAARYRQQAANAESRPYWMYNARNDARTRPAHRALDSHVFRHDDPIWRRLYPPNGWRCRCRVRALTEAQVRARGLQIRSSEGNLREVEQVVGRDPRTGDPVMGKGAAYDFIDRDGKPWTLTPDPGWSYNPGRHDLDGDAADRLIARIDAAPPDLQRAAVGAPWSNPLFHRHLEGKKGAGDWPVASAPAAVLAPIGAKSPTVRLSRSTADKQGLEHPDLRPEDYARVQRILDRGEAFRSSPLNVIGFLEEEEGRPWRAVLKATRDRSKTYLVTLHKAQPYDLRAARRRWPRIDQEGKGG